jgi:hypothetical protein
MRSKARSGRFGGMAAGWMSRLADFYLRFYRADNATSSKDQEPLDWFVRLLKAR